MRTKPYNQHAGLGLKDSLYHNCKNFISYNIKIKRKTNTPNLKLDDKLQWSIKQNYKGCHKT